MASLRVPISVHGLDHAITVSVGVTYPSLMALHGQEGLSASDVVEEADAAMYWAKQEGKDRVGVFASDLSTTPLCTECVGHRPRTVPLRSVGRPCRPGPDL